VTWIQSLDWEDPLEKGIQDTEFLLRHLIDGQFNGREIEQASMTLKKLKEIHSKLMEFSIEV